MAALIAPSLAAAEASDPLYQRLVYEHDPESVQSAAGTERDVATRRVDYARIGGDAISGYMARPADREGTTPAVLVIHERWGLNEDIRALSRRLAANGYTALAVDLYEGETADTPEQARTLLQQARSNEQRLERNLREASLYLDLMPSTTGVGSVGWSFGGGWSLRTALMQSDMLDAAVIYYGEVVTDAEQLEGLQAPILGHFGGEDSTIPSERVSQFDTALDDLDKDHEIHMYEGAGHAFANPSGTRYAAEPADRAWQRTLDFLERTLEPEENEQDLGETEVAAAGD